MIAPGVGPPGSPDSPESPEASESPDPPGQLDPVDPVGVVLAAGRGRRFGATKQLAVLDGRPLVVHALEPLVEAGLDVLVVVGHDAERVVAALPTELAGRRIHTVVNADVDRGQGSSLATAARAIGRRDLVVVLGDQPGIPAADVDRVVAALADGAVSARIVHDDGPGHPVGFAASLHARLVDLAADGAGRDLLAEVGGVALSPHVPRPIDVDTPTDLDRLRSGSAEPAEPAGNDQA